MYIGKAAQLSGTTIKSIRHYEDIGLLPAPQRRGNYRVYCEQSVERLMFIKCAQQLGFKLKEMLAILDDHRGQTLPWEVVRNAVTYKKQAVMNQIQALQNQHAGLVEFETRFLGAHELCQLQNL
jgi:Predicted transcriptional regulators